MPDSISQCKRPSWSNVTPGIINARGPHGVILPQTVYISARSPHGVMLLQALSMQEALMV